MSISNRPVQPPTHSSNINIFILIIIIILDDSDHHTRSRGVAKERERYDNVSELSARFAEIPKVLQPFLNT